MRGVPAFTAMVAAVLNAALAANIDNGGFTYDGTTTYCMGTNGAVGDPKFDALVANNVGRCPVGVTVKLTASAFHVNDPIIVQWSAKTNAAVTNSIFPNAIDKATGLPQPVTTSTLFACTVGTNCATHVGGTPKGDGGQRTGAFGADGSKALENNEFKIATPGDFIVVGIVALPGDPTLNVAASEYIVFKKISVVPANVELPNNATALSESTSPPKLSDNQDDKSDQNSDEKKSSATEHTTTDFSGSTKTTSTSSGSSGLGGSGVAIIGAVLGCCVVVIAGFGFIVRRGKKQPNESFEDNSSSSAGAADESALNVNNGEKVDHAYIASISARNDNNNAIDMTSETPVVVPRVSSRRRKSSKAVSARSISKNRQSSKSSVDADEYSEKLSYCVNGQNGTDGDAYRTSYISDLSSTTSGQQSEASMSNYSGSTRHNNFAQSDNGSEKERKENTRATEDSIDMGHSRLQSEASVGPYGFRESSASVDSYGSGMSYSSREGSRISGFSVDSNYGN